MDVKGAFDAVLRNRLTQRLHRQGWPLNLIRWNSPADSRRAPRSPRYFIYFTLWIATPSTAQTNETSRRAEQAIQRMVEWSKSTAVTFDPAKTEIIHFTRKRASEAPTIRHENKVNKAAPSMRWLGVYLDSKLKFNAHITY
ncbi:hypothetical protein VHEMI02462 [[Torrubiella] hemipterigena]|uniref:Reverse transcriptase domain-containing protein n=1 Tax=[Torrubiella] hemipterigena TaxID=1531966 RepID=A0A0A1SVT2_9HYPO|nr:hypothetical protein VHEMI02462 [[Torrubiella] hemipterigena]